MNDFEKEVISRLSKIETKIDGIKKIEENATQALYMSTTNEEKIKKLEADQNWTWRTIAGIIIAYVLNLIFSIKGGVK